MFDWAEILLFCLELFLSCSGLSFIKVMIFQMYLDDFVEEAIIRYPDIQDSMLRILGVRIFRVNTVHYYKCFKFFNTFLFLFSNKIMVLIRA